MLISVVSRFPDHTHGHRAGAPPQLLTRIRGQYRECPGSALTLQQARRLLGLDTMTCAAALAVLERAGFLATTRDGRFVLAENGPA